MPMIRSFASNSLRRLARTILYGSNDSKPISPQFSERLDSGTKNRRMQYPADADKGTNSEHSKTRLAYSSTGLPLARCCSDEAEKAAQVVETAAELVEMVADAAETLSNGVAQKLPEDGKLRDAVVFVEHVSKEAEKDAQRTIEFVRKVNELKQEMESLVEPVFHQLKHVEKQAKDK
ncbi:hypothetical protein ACLOJK_016389 [Asimina triloba]